MWGMEWSHFWCFIGGVLFCIMMDVLCSWFMSRLDRTLNRKEKIVIDIQGE